MGCCQSDKEKNLQDTLGGDLTVINHGGRVVTAVNTNKESNLSAITGLVLYIQRINSNGQYGQWNQAKVVDGSVKFKFPDEIVDILIYVENKNLQLKIKSNPNVFTLYLGKEIIVRNGNMSYNMKIMKEALFDENKVSNDVVKANCIVDEDDVKPPPKLYY